MRMSKLQGESKAMTKQLKFLFGAVLASVALVAAVGCPGGGTGDKVIVKGKVTVDDKAAEGVTLSFYGPDDKAASGVVITQADGTYEVMFNTAAGEGNYKVTASKPKTPGAAGPQKGEGIDDFQLGLGGGLNNNALPARYNDLAKSGLSAPLQKGMNEGKNFALKSK
jgi:hypothetical protein